MVQLDTENNVKRRCCGFGSKIQTAVLPDGGSTREFQNWRLSFGHAKPTRKRTKVVSGLTREAIETDRAGVYVHGQLLEAAAPKNLFSPDYYFIEYRMPEAPFTVRVEIDNVGQLCRAYDELATLPKKVLQRMILKVIPRDHDVDKPVFDERPARTVKSQLKSRAAMTRYMVDLYASDKLSVDTLSVCMAMKMQELRDEVHRSLPVHEKEEHNYLIAAQHKTKRMTLEQRYITDEIDLQTYADTRDPERKERRLHDQATYPLPETLYKCIVCRRPDAANIKCMECANRACRECVDSKFLSCADDRAFVLLHHIYCLKLGEPISKAKGPRKNNN